jgi:hypothetical protein
MSTITSADAIRFPQVMSDRIAAEFEVNVCNKSSPAELGI